MRFLATKYLFGKFSRELFGNSRFPKIKVSRHTESQLQIEFSMHFGNRHLLASKLNDNFTQSRMFSVHFGALEQIA